MKASLLNLNDRLPPLDYQGNIRSVYDQSRVKLGTVGVTPVITSFYDSDNGEWTKDSHIDPNDESGQRFLTEMTGENTPGVIDYAINAWSKHKYDFKTTNGTDNYNASLDIYRGMPMGKTAVGETIYTSARDIGNIVAGYVSAANGLPWAFTRMGFDGYQSYQDSKFTTEGVSSQNAQAYGWHLRSMNDSIFIRTSNILMLLYPKTLLINHIMRWIIK